jgi:hypothetical protein
MKREFGKKLIEDFLTRVDLQAGRFTTASATPSRRTS